MKQNKTQWEYERKETIKMLRRICEEQGDNDWPDDLHLADIIDKHLWRHLPEVDSTNNTGADNG